MFLIDGKIYKIRTRDTSRVKLKCFSMIYVNKQKGLVMNVNVCLKII